MKQVEDAQRNKMGEDAQDDRRNNPTRILGNINSGKE